MAKTKRNRDGRCTQSDHPSPQAKYPVSPINPNTSKRYKRKVDIDEAVIMHFKGASQGEIARHFNVDNSAISQLFTKYLIPSADIEIFKKYREQIYAGKELKNLQALTDKKIKKSTAVQNARIARDFHEVHRLETGQSTENIALMINGSPAIVEAVKAAADDYLKRLMDGNGDENTGTDNED